MLGWERFLTGKAIRRVVGPEGHNHPEHRFIRGEQIQEKYI